MEIKNLRIVDKGAVKATFEIYIPEWSLHILCTLMDKNGSRWVSMPSRPFEKDGQTKYQWQAWFDKDYHKRLEEAIIKMIDAGKYEKIPEKTQSHAPQAPPLADDVPF